MRNSFVLKEIFIQMVEIKIVVTTWGLINYLSQKIIIALCTPSMLIVKNHVLTKRLIYQCIGDLKKKKAWKTFFKFNIKFNLSKKKSLKKEQKIMHSFHIIDGQYVQIKAIYLDDQAWKTTCQHGGSTPGCDRIILLDKCL